ncbi:YopX family protein [Secundilactobacillus yichangensis]|uniref:YopX family protein n=1 Tax=Secundilactobacillus yichangensis TaxID=2799580 RepID=UPI0019444C8C|nr:YopX family protein [Secundilactobacillus yichangensis]
MVPKFRAWDKKTKEYFHISELWNSGTNPECFNFDGWTDNFGNEGRLKDIVIEQYTGLQDANGDDIYENDLVLLDPDDQPYLIILNEGKFELSSDYLGLVYDLGEEYMDCEIIGDVHTDGDLIDR